MILNWWRSQRAKQSVLAALPTLTSNEADQLLAIPPLRWSDAELALLVNRLNEAGLMLVSDAIVSLMFDKVERNDPRQP